MKLKPPFRADHVGSLLRTPTVKENRLRWKRGEISADTLRVIENREIAATVKRLEATGMKSITDGEFRRDYFHLDFLKQLEGVSVTGGIDANPNAKVAEDGFTPPKLSVTGKLKHVRNIQVDDFNFLKSVTTETPKVSIPSPTMVHFRGGRKSIAIDAYPDMEEFFEDLAVCYRAEINALYSAGCRYIQLDDTNLAYLCDPKMREAAKERGEDPNELPRTYAALINSVIDNRPDDLTVGIHLCRGNYRSTWFAEGGYEPVAEVLFNSINVDAYFLEYDDERSGDFAPLRFVPKDKVVVLGIMSSKLSALESVKALEKRIKEAAQFMPLDNMTELQQWKKFERLVKTAETIWG
jgi:5-methyltetrahydropteroyltriglutamate--homocysteine methyltransferase